MLRCTINVSHVLLHTHTIHRNPIGPRVICVTLISTNFFLLLSSLVLMHLIGEVYSRLSQLTSIPLKRMQCLLLLLNFVLMTVAHIALLL